MLANHDAKKQHVYGSGRQAGDSILSRHDGRNGALSTYISRFFGAPSYFRKGAGAEAPALFTEL